MSAGDTPDPVRVDCTCKCDGPDLTLAFVLLLFIAAVVFGVGTRPGNRIMCEQDLAPTFIDCTRVTAE